MLGVALSLAAFARPAAAQDRPLGIPATRDGSGTAWQPDATPMHAYHASAAGWQLMLHGLLFAGFDTQATDRAAARSCSAPAG